MPKFIAHHRGLNLTRENIEQSRGVIKSGAITEGAVKTINGFSPSFANNVYHEQKKGGEKMAYTLACRDTGMTDCPFVARAESEEEVLAQAAKHGKEVHGYTDEQLNDPQLMEKIKAVIKEV